MRGRGLKFGCQVLCRPLEKRFLCVIRRLELKQRWCKLHCSLPGNVVLRRKEESQFQLPQIHLLISSDGVEKKLPLPWFLPPVPQY